VRVQGKLLTAHGSRRMVHGKGNLFNCFY